MIIHKQDLSLMNKVRSKPLLPGREYLNTFLYNRTKDILVASDGHVLFACGDVSHEKDESYNIFREMAGTGKGWYEIKPTWLDMKHDNKIYIDGMYLTINPPENPQTIAEKQAADHSLDDVTYWKNLDLTPLFCNLKLIKPEQWIDVNADYMRLLVLFTGSMRTMTADVMTTEAHRQIWARRFNHGAIVCSVIR